MIILAYYRKIKRSWHYGETEEKGFDIYSELFTNTNALLRYRMISPISKTVQISPICVSRFTLTGLAYSQLCKKKFWEF